MCVPLISTKVLWLAQFNPDKRNVREGGDLLIELVEICNPLKDIWKIDSLDSLISPRL